MIARKSFDVLDNLRLIVRRSFSFPPFCSRYENHSPSTTQGNGTSSTSERDERNGTDKAVMNIKNEVNFLESLKTNANLINLSFPLQTVGAEDLRIKLEMRHLQSPLASSAPPTPTTPMVPYASQKGIPVGLEGTIAPADMLNVLSAHRESVNTADGKDQTPLNSHPQN
jgi:GDNF-inducible zinc finger protein 1